MDKHRTTNETEAKGSHSARKVGGLWLDPMRFPHLIKNNSGLNEKEEKPS